MNKYEFAEHVENKNWIFAKTMPQNPHWYILRKNMDDKLFSEMVLAIREHGEIETYWKSRYTVLNVNGCKYWTMGAPLEETILINKKIISYQSQYNEICKDYDSHYSGLAYEKEDEELLSKIEIKGSLLDIGCGTGLLLKYVSPLEYLGIDISAGMLSIAKERYPARNFLNTSIEHFYKTGFDTIVSLYGSMSYVGENQFLRIKDMLNPGGSAYLVYYSEGYDPETHRLFGINGLSGFFPTGEKFGNYQIVRLDK